MTDVTLEPPSEEDESEDCDEGDDEDWAWLSAGAHLSKRSNSQVRPWLRLLVCAGAGSSHTLCFHPGQQAGRVQQGAALSPGPQGSESIRAQDQPG